MARRISTGASASAANANDPRKYTKFIEYFSPGTYTFTVPTGVKKVRAVVVGAGGGGGASQDYYYYGGDGGGGGGFAMGEYDVTPGQQITVTVGSGGTGGYSPGWTSPYNGADGGSSSFGAFCSGYFCSKCSFK